MSSDLPEEWRDQFLETREIPGHGLCGVQAFILTSGLLTGLKLQNLTYDFKARYCFESSAAALHALSSWDGAGDPPGPWIKEKVSDRLGPGAKPRLWLGTELTKKRKKY